MAASLWHVRRPAARLAGALKDRRTVLWAALCGLMLVALMAHADEESLERAKVSFMFEAEVSRVLDILINSLYTDKSIFVRELISNASDALDRFRFLLITHPEWADADFSPEIHVQALPASKAVRFQDNGIGMTRAELIENLGRIAKSGTSDFVRDQDITEETNIIGMFGVGFYSAFLVADRVEVFSRHPSSDAIWRWESEGNGNFTVEEVDEPTVNTPRERDPIGAHGTRIILHLKEKYTREFTDEDKLEGLLQRYSQFINYPLGMWSMVHERLEVSLDEDGNEVFRDVHPEDEDFENVMDLGDDVSDLELDTFDEDLDEDSLRHDTVIKWDFRRINTQPPIWLRRPETVQRQEYHDFFASLTGTGDEPGGWLHYQADSGPVAFRALLYIPKSRAFNAFHDDAQARGVRLYRQRVFVSDETPDFLPPYLGFVRGALDSPNIPLNVNREVVAESKTLRAIRQNIVKRLVRWLNDWSKRALVYTLGEEPVPDPPANAPPSSPAELGDADEPGTSGELGDDGAPAPDADSAAAPEDESVRTRNMRKLQDESWGADAYDPYMNELEDDEHFQQVEHFGEARTLEFQQDASEDASEDDEDDEDSTEASAALLDRHAYASFWEAFGDYIKFGMANEPNMRFRLAPLLRFRSTVDGGKELQALDEYMARTRAGQKRIYYMVGHSVELLLGSPQLEQFKESDTEVLLLVDNIDGMMMNDFKRYKGYDLVDIGQDTVRPEDLGLTAPDRNADGFKKLRRAYKPLLAWLRGQSDGELSRVKLSQRLSGSPAMVTTRSGGMSLAQERWARTQMVGEAGMTKVMRADKVLEINPRSPIVIRLAELHRDDPKDTLTRAWGHLVMCMAGISSGVMLSSTTELVHSIRALMVHSNEVGEVAGTGTDLDIALQIYPTLLEDEAAKAVAKEADADESVQKVEIPLQKVEIPLHEAEIPLHEAGDSGVDAFDDL